MFSCSCCGRKMPPDPGGFEIPVDWATVKVEEHRKTKIDVRYLYLCPHCTIILAPRQERLQGAPPEAPEPPSQQ
jgi:hypothetical protein